MFAIYHKMLAAPFGKEIALFSRSTASLADNPSTQPTMLHTSLDRDALSCKINAERGIISAEKGEGYPQCVDEIPARVPLRLK